MSSDDEELGALRAARAAKQGGAAAGESYVSPSPGNFCSHTAMQPCSI